MPHPQVKPGTVKPGTDGTLHQFLPLPSFFLPIRESRNEVPVLRESSASLFLLAWTHGPFASRRRGRCPASCYGAAKYATSYFSSDADRLTYLQLLRECSQLYGLSLLGYCLMSNHVHLIAVPHSAEALAQSLKQAHGRYAAYWNARQSSTGHVWQGRFVFVFPGRARTCGLRCVMRRRIRYGRGWWKRPSTGDGRARRRIVAWQAQTPCWRWSAGADDGQQWSGRSFWRKRIRPPR